MNSPWCPGWVVYDAMVVRDGPMDVSPFLGYPWQCLAPLLRLGDIVVIGDALDAAHTTECSNYFNACGYGDYSGLMLCAVMGLAFR